MDKLVAVGWAVFGIILATAVFKLSGLLKQLKGYRDRLHDVHSNVEGVDKLLEAQMQWNQKLTAQISEMISEVQLHGQELSRLKAKPSTPDSIMVEQYTPDLPGIDVSAFGSNPLTGKGAPAMARPLPHTPTPKVDALLEHLDPERKKRLALLQLAIAHVGDSPACCKCKHWDLEEGQQGIFQQFPVFAKAASVVSPNRMDTPVLTDAAGDKLPEDQQPPPLFPAKFNRWELFGACLLDTCGRHAIDKCPSFEASA